MLDKHDIHSFMLKYLKKKLSQNHVLIQSENKSSSKILNKGIIVSKNPFSSHNLDFFPFWN